MSEHLGAPNSRVEKLSRFGDAPEMVQVTYYLEVVSSWCFWAEPAWLELKQHYSGRVQFDWKLALMPPEAYPISRSQCDWFYRRSGSIMRSGFMLNSGWFETECVPYQAPNYIAEAARQMGITDDRVRMALSRAAVCEGKKIGRWEVAAQIASDASGLQNRDILEHAKSQEIKARVEQTTAEFHALQVTQRPTFLIQNSIGDRATFSGIVRAEPLAAAIDSLLNDEAAYTSWKAHFGDPPQG